MTGSQEKHCKKDIFLKPWSSWLFGRSQLFDNFVSSNKFMGFGYPDRHHYSFCFSDQPSGAAPRWEEQQLHFLCSISGSQFGFHVLRILQVIIFCIKIWKLLALFATCIKSQIWTILILFQGVFSNSWLHRVDHFDQLLNFTFCIPHI